MKNLFADFRKTFGSGPAGVVASLVLLFIAYLINRQLDLPPLTDNQPLLNGIFIAAIVLTLVLIAWSLRSLPAADRGNRLCTTGAFRYVRHPLYAAFLSVFNFGLAIWLNSYVYIAWALLLHPVWHYLVLDEERMMVATFGDDYREYRKRTRRFVPRFMKRSE
ncbi:isoprenylcysteine carboxylmethyltransferase family protein [Methanoregula sp.]|uniref:methyltransferase family protein n=1 Tax=Methanoregula sp. TaxID=2052170 RepID=UPI00260E44DE|nr:isoprenylcysteine carboxylmethyltransferase family protein [Methanoregula sp.]MDD5144302.1 isoprenylcysteine carboxylmethyltransferase family protein [Methanoregula sp.]